MEKPSIEIIETTNTETNGDDCAVCAGKMNC